MNELIEKTFNYCRKRGFPHYDLSINQKLKEFNNLKNFDLDSIVNDRVVRQTLHGMGMAWSYFPHHREIKSGKMKTAWDVFNNMGEGSAEFIVASDEKEAVIKINELINNETLSRNLSNNAKNIFTGRGEDHLCLKIADIIKNKWSILI
jgi:ATP:corrinoid adenosyltransferase